MASLLSSHLEQISLCANSIAALPFPGPRSFTNSILSNHDITALIRDTETHERALFHLAPPPLTAKSSGADFASSASDAASLANRRSTAYASRQPKNKAVVAVLGGDLYAKIQRQPDSRQKGEVDVELLLQGAEKLAAVYPIPGAADRISQLRRRHQQLEANIAHYVDRVAEQRKEFDKMEKPSSAADSEENEDVEDDETSQGWAQTERVVLAQEDWDVAEEDIKELERKKKSLEDRVTGMERDLSGLIRS